MREAVVTKEEFKSLQPGDWISRCSTESPERMVLHSKIQKHSLGRYPIVSTLAQRLGRTGAMTIGIWNGECGLWRLVRRAAWGERELAERLYEMAERSKGMGPEKLEEFWRMMLTSQTASVYFGHDERRPLERLP